MIKATDFIHPEDAAALRQLESIPGFPTLVKKLMSMGLEQLQYGVNMASAIRLSPSQLPKLYNRLSNRSFISLWILILTHGPLAIQRFL